MTDVLTQYLHHTRNEGKVPSESGFEKSKAGPSEERQTHPLAWHSKLTDAAGNDFALGGETVQDRYDRLERQKQAEEFNRKHARPVPVSYGLQADTPEHRIASASHAQEIAKGIRESEQEEES